MKKNPSNLFSIVDLRTVCIAQEEDFKNLGTTIDTEDDLFYTYIDRGSKILGIAHLDSVQTASFCSMVGNPGNQRIYSPALDDRLGVYILLYLLPAMGINVDVLLTTGEEVGKSTAKNFKPNKQYNWMFSFDRKADDVVTYQYSDTDLNHHLIKHGFKTGQGSFSDISYAEHLGIKGFNIGAGYHDYHSQWAYCEYNQLIAQVIRFSRFFWELRATKMPHKKSKILSLGRRGRATYESDRSYGYLFPDEDSFRRADDRFDKIKIVGAKFAPYEMWSPSDNAWKIMQYDDVTRKSILIGYRIGAVISSVSQFEIKHEPIFRCRTCQQVTSDSEAETTGGCPEYCARYLYAD